MATIRACHRRPGSSGEWGVGGALGPDVARLASTQSGL
jgi:hypothetical protein